MVSHFAPPSSPYARAYDPTVERNRRAQNEDARLGIANPLRSIRRYDTILLASPSRGQVRRCSTTRRHAKAPASEQYSQSEAKSSRNAQARADVSAWLT